MPIQEFFELVDILTVGLKEEMRDQMSIQSFGAWQIIETLKAMLSNGDNSIPYMKYLESLGMIEKSNEKENLARIRAEKEQALANAEEIMKIYRGQIA